MLKETIRRFLPKPVYTALLNFRNNYLDGHATKSYLQEGEDLILHSLFDRKTDGFHVDVGAHHPMHFPNTFLFYKKAGLLLCWQKASTVPVDTLAYSDVHAFLASVGYAAYARQPTPWRSKELMPELFDSRMPCSVPATPLYLILSPLNSSHMQGMTL